MGEPESVCTRFIPVMDDGASGVMIAPIPSLNTEEKIYNYFAQVFEPLGPDIPVCYQDYPQTTSVHISVGCFNRLVRDFPQLVMFKHEDCPGLGKLTRVRKSAEEENLRRVSILVGNGGLHLPQELARGADGAMTGFAYPEMLVEVVALHHAGEAAQAEDLFDAYVPLVRLSSNRAMAWRCARRSSAAAVPFPMPRRGLRDPS